MIPHIRVVTLKKKKRPQLNKGFTRGRPPCVVRTRGEEEICSQDLLCGIKCVKQLLLEKCFMSCPQSCAITHACNGF